VSYWTVARDPVTLRLVVTAGDRTEGKTKQKKGLLGLRRILLSSNGFPYDAYEYDVNSTHSTTRAHGDRFFPVGRYEQTRRPFELSRGRKTARRLVPSYRTYRRCDLVKSKTSRPTVLNCVCIYGGRSGVRAALGPVRFWPVAVRVRGIDTIRNLIKSNSERVFRDRFFFFLIFLFLLLLAAKFWKQIPRGNGAVWNRLKTSRAFTQSSKIDFKDIIRSRFWILKPVSCLNVVFNI